jgi:hypothetical protein
MEIEFSSLWWVSNLGAFSPRINANLPHAHFGSSTPWLFKALKNISLEASSGKVVRMQRVNTACLAAWEAVCKPTIYGGLGLHSLKLINTA